MILMIVVTIGIICVNLFWTIFMAEYSLAAKIAWGVSSTFVLLIMAGYFVGIEEKIIGKEKEKNNNKVK